MFHLRRSIRPLARDIGSQTMKASNLRPPGALPRMLAACILFPMGARADAINFGFLAVAGVVVVVPLTLFVVLVEGFILSIGLKIPSRRTIWAMGIANLVRAVQTRRAAFLGNGLSDRNAAGDAASAANADRPALPIACLT
jgi:hypothetical protein